MGFGGKKLRRVRNGGRSLKILYNKKGLKFIRGDSMKKLLGILLMVLLVSLAFSSSQEATPTTVPEPQTQQATSTEVLEPQVLDVQEQAVPSLEELLNRKFEIQQELISLEKYLNDYLKTSVSSVVEMTDFIKTIEELIKTINEKMISLDEEIDIKVNEIQIKLTDFESNITPVIESYKNEIEILKTEMESLKKEMESLKNENTQLKARLDSIESSIKSLQSSSSRPGIWDFIIIALCIAAAAAGILIK